MPDWAKDWQEFSSKPMGLLQDKKYKAKEGRQDVLDAMIGLSKGTGAQTACDPDDSPRGSKATEKDNLKLRNDKFSNNIVLFKKDSAKMMSALKKMLEDTDKGAEADLYRNLKILITGTDAFAARMEQHAKTWAANAKDAKTWDKVNEVEDPEEKKLAKEIRALEISLRDCRVSLNASLKKALLAAQKIKADPTAKTYNEEMDKGGRDLYMTLTAIYKIKTDKVVSKQSEAKKLPDPGSSLGLIKQYGESAGSWRTMPDASTPDQILVQLKEFSQLVKSIAMDYGKFLKG